MFGTIKTLKGILGRPLVTGNRSQYYGPYDPVRWNFEAQASFQRINSALEHGRIMVNVYGASEGTPHNLISEEGERSGLTTRGIWYARDRDEQSFDAQDDARWAG